MSLKGIDVSNWQASLNAGAIEADFVIVKATEGVGYVDPSCDKHFQNALKAGKRLGVYHFARNASNSSDAEADFFVNNIKGYIGKAVLVLDWEDSNKGDVAWAKRWLDRVFEKTGVRPMIYMSESVVNSFDWSAVVAGNYGLWVAKYRDYAADFNYDMGLAGTAPSVKHWNGYAMWQWTSSGRLNGYDGNLDLNEFYGDAKAWDAYAGKSDASAPNPVPTPPNPTPAPEAPQSQYYTVQRGDTLSGIASKFGTTYQHLAAINGITNPNFITTGQVLLIDSAPTSPNPQVKTYTVQRGDTLSGIAAQFGTTYQVIAQINGIANPNLIYPGQVLRIP